jgi:hypothetical protein
LLLPVVWLDGQIRSIAGNLKGEVRRIDYYYLRVFFRGTLEFGASWVIFHKKIMVDLLSLFEFNNIISSLYYS